MEGWSSQLFSQPDAKVFVVLDGAKVRGLVKQLEEAQPEYCCLYRGELIPELAEVVPYLVRLERETEFLEWVLSGMGKQWGIFAVAKANLRTMCQHFRSLLTVELPSGQTVAFRFYDPRVFRVFWPTCEEEKQRLVFGPILRYLVEEEKGQTFLHFMPPELRSDAQIEKKRLVIREEQREVLKQYMVKQFEERMVLHLRRVFPEKIKFLSEQELRTQTQRGINQSAQYQITVEGDVQRYLECAVVYGWDFHATSWAREILCHNDWNGEMKMDKIEQTGLALFDGKGGA